MCRQVCADIPYFEHSLFATSLTMVWPFEQSFMRSSGEVELSVFQPAFKTSGKRVLPLKRWILRSSGWPIYFAPPLLTLLERCSVRFSDFRGPIFYKVHHLLFLKFNPSRFSKRRKIQSVLYWRVFLYEFPWCIEDDWLINE